MLITIFLLFAIQILGYLCAWNSLHNFQTEVISIILSCASVHRLRYCERGWGKTLKCVLSGVTGLKVEKT